MIKVENLTKKYGKFSALKDVNLEVKEKECFTLLGFNGAGKTTFINVVTSTIPFDTGKVFVNGLDLQKNKTEIKKIINVSPQESAVVKNLTVEENLKLIANLYDLDNVDFEVDNIIDTFDLKEKRKVLAKKLSGGQIKRLSIALAVITKPKILFLDEPTLGLDVLARRKLWELIERLKKTMTIFLTTHYLEEVERLTDRIGVISKGSIKCVGTLEEILKLTGCNNLEDSFIKLSEESL